jgi:hypothetical protein
MSKDPVSIPFEQATIVDAHVSPNECRDKALDCLITADSLDDPRERTAMLRYAEWWTRLAELARERQNNKNS